MSLLARSLRSGNLRRSFSTSNLLEDAVVHKRGDVTGYGSKEYLLVPWDATFDELKKDPKVAYGSLFCHRNIIFGARILNPSFKDLVEVCTPLLQAAIQDVGEIGDQPQAVASLAGLSEFVVECIEKEDPILEKLDEMSLEACKAMATGNPRPGHSILGVGTFRDGEQGWEILAREFVKRDLASEPNLYKSQAGHLVTVEHLADKSAPYIKTAGGAMARFFFV